MNRPIWTVLAGLLILGGCNRDARLAGKNIPSVTVKPVTHFGVTLDESASPKQVAYVLLRAVRDDFLADTEAEREAAMQVQFDVCAANVLASGNRTSTSRDEFIYDVVYHWTPTVSHYVGDFETEWSVAASRLVQTEPAPVSETGDGALECEVRMQLNDPGGDPNARVVMIIWMVQDEGMWRATHLGFDATRRSISNSE